MYNYCSIGLDAKFCLGFHNMREKYPYLFKSRVGNKFIYGQLGMENLITKKNVNLGKNATLICDDRVVELPDCENLIFLNISSWQLNFFKKRYNFLNKIILNRAGGATKLWPQTD